MPTYCPRCGFREPLDPQLCYACMDGEADPQRATEILAAAEAGNGDALRMLAAIDDSRAIDVILTAAGHPNSDLRRAAFTSLSAIGDPRAESIAIDALGDADVRVRAAAIGCLADIDGPGAADALAGQLAHPEDRVHAATALAWLHDDRAVEPLLAAVDHPSLGGNAYRSVGSALAWIGDPATVPPLVRVLEEMTERWVASQPTPGSPPRPDWGAEMVATDVATALLLIGGSAAEAAVARAQRGFGGSLRPFLPVAPEYRPFAYRAAPDRLRTVRRWSLELRPAGMPVRAPVTKFGGQPVWLDAPTWPVGKDGGPMTFMAQFAVPDDDGLAYLFIDPSPLDALDFGDPGWAGCLFMQPGPPPPRHVSQAVGPTYASEVHDTSRDRFVLGMRFKLTEYLPTLEAGWEYPDWEVLRTEPPTDRDDDRDWNKIGGSPRYLQGGPPPGEWRFLFQFTAQHVGREMADGAECYGLIDPDRRGLFLVEGH
ncbi:MAG TPA: HEAT repeat domain-containing protein [Candidatus Limnocylindria bacterium]|nr:HEAT repeat domain-containing protein [Candidatus Limnocylindria bacterium]